MTVKQAQSSSLGEKRVKGHFIDWDLIMDSSTHNDGHCRGQKEAVREEDCSGGLYSGMPDIPPG